MPPQELVAASIAFVAIEGATMASWATASDASGREEDHPVRPQPKLVATWLLTYLTVAMARLPSRGGRVTTFVVAATTRKGRDHGYCDLVLARSQPWWL